MTSAQRSEGQFPDLNWKFKNPSGLPVVGPDMNKEANAPDRDLIHQCLLYNGLKVGANITAFNPSDQPETRLDDDDVEMWQDGHRQFHIRKPIAFKGMRALMESVYEGVESACEEGPPCQI